LDDRRAVQIDDDLEPFLSSSGFQNSTAARDDVIENDGFGRDGELVTLLAGVVEHVLDQAVEARGFRFHDTELALRMMPHPLRCRAVRRHLRVKADVGERRLQLVGNLVHKGHTLLRDADSLALSWK
jgi:hypothetical protein